MTLTEILRNRFKNLLHKVASFLLSIGLTPNFVTMLGFLGNVCAAFFIEKGDLTIGGLVALSSGAFDAIDGTMARLSDSTNKFGCMIDSLIDRYSEMTLLLGILVYFTSRHNEFGVIFTYLAMCGSVLVSYIRARAGGLGLEVKRGILTRVERLLVLVISLLINQPFPGIIVIAVLSNFTAFQRLWLVHSYLKENQ